MFKEKERFIQRITFVERNLHRERYGFREGSILEGIAEARKE